MSHRNKLITHRAAPRADNLKADNNQRHRERQRPRVSKERSSRMKLAAPRPPLLAIPPFAFSTRTKNALAYPAGARR